MSKPTVMVVDDSFDVVDTVGRYLGDEGFHVEPATSGALALRRLEDVSCDVVLTDLRMPDIDGIDLLEGIHKVDPELPVIIMTAFGDIDSAVDAMQRGAYHYVTKPFKMAAVRGLVDRAARQRRGHEQNRQLKAAFRERLGTVGLVGGSATVNELRALIHRVANAPSAVLVLGETGTGKETVARAIHLESDRRDASFVAVNCAALPEMLLDSELFGHTKDAFPGATSVRRGLFVEADGGTLFLDEVGDLPLAIQAKFLRILQTKELRAVGSEESRHVNVRCIAATQRDLHALVKDGRFREDLYFRLNVLPMRVAPLRERLEDVAPLVEYFLRRHDDKDDGPGHALTPEALRLLEEHLWPGNVRELENLIERLVVTSPTREIGADAVRAAIAPVAPTDPVELLAATSVSFDELEKRYSDAVLRLSRGNKAKAASILGIDVSTLYRRGKPRR
ncbi:MAG: DNA-binding response regulator [Myxococcales bacterium]|nr:DNA-binding response regulator [Myxococcales bacterium]